MRGFSNLRAEHLVGLGYWFWACEAISFYWDRTCDIPDHFKEEIRDAEGFWQHFFLFLMPVNLLLLMILVWSMSMVVGPYLQYSYAQKAIKKGQSVTMYNQKCIDYFTVLDRLSGGRH